MLFGDLFIMLLFSNKMIKKNKLKFIFCISIFLLFIFQAQLFCYASLAPNVDGKILDQTMVFQGSAGFEDAGETTVAEIISIVIEAFLGLLGIIFIILIILGGYNWMTASGDEQKVEKAKDTIKRAIIGLVIVISAYAITYFVFTNLPGVGDGNTGPGGHSL